MIRAVLEALVLVLRNNIPDPDTTRTGNYIYPGWPRQDATLPRAGILGIGVTEDERTLENTSVFTLRYQIEVWVDMRKTFTIDTVDYSGAKLRDYLADSVISTLRANRTFAGGVVDVTITNAQDFEEKELKMLRKSITIDVKYIEY